MDSIQDRVFTLVPDLGGCFKVEDVIELVKGQYKEGAVLTEEQVVSALKFLEKEKLLGPFTIENGVVTVTR